MPIYEHRCQNPDCGHEFEEIRPLSESKKSTKCPKCGWDAKKIPSENARHLSWTQWKAMG